MRFFGSLLFTLFCLSACGGGGDGSSSTPLPESSPPPVSPPAPAEPDRFATPQTTSRFLTMATFGPTANEVARLTGTKAADWLLEQFEHPPSPFLSEVETYYNMGSPARGMLADAFDQGATTWVFWKNAVHGEDQLRQRMAFALSQILVVSNASGGLLGIFPQTMGYYQDLLLQHAFGNYRDLLEAVTYSPAMAEYLTYLGNQKGDDSTGRVPDENYAREILQLFTIGLVELNLDGTPVTDAEGNAIEVFDNQDVSGLARVFTGLNNQLLSLRNLVGRIDQITRAVTVPLAINEEWHSTKEKTFLGLNIPANTRGEASIRLALDHIMAHPNVGPFVAKQLIQRFVTSNPSPRYVARVATAFNQGTFTLPNGELVGESRKGDLKATIAAILFDPDTDIETALASDTFGKVREPLLRLTHFMRAFNTDMTTPEYVLSLYDTSSLSVLGQHPYRSPSVFNFYRPGYIAPGTLFGAAGLVAPELQIVNTSSIPGYVNLLSYGTFQSQRDSYPQMLPIFERFNAPFDPVRAQSTFIADYSEAMAIVDDDPAKLIDYLDELLVYGTLSEDTRLQLRSTLLTFPSNLLQSDQGKAALVGYAVLMVMSTPEYLIQR